MSDRRETKTLLFDLDGTLIKLDMNAFLPRYFKALASRFTHMVEPATLVGNVLASTEAMIANLDPTVTNREAFMRDFLPRMSRAQDEILPILDDFYGHDFAHLAGSEVASPACQRAVELALARGFEVVIATNPVFPLQAIRHRLVWGGFDPDAFHLVTAYEDMHFCKPHVEYYQEILGLLGRSPDECWMIGNDVGEDMVAARLGIKTFLVEDLLIAKDGDIPNPTRRGRMSDLPDFVAALA